MLDDLFDGDLSSTEDGFRAGDDAVTLRHGGLTRESAKAYCLRMGDKGAEVWWPKSKVICLDDKTVTVTYWIYGQKQAADELPEGVEAEDEP